MNDTLNSDQAYCEDEPDEWDENWPYCTCDEEPTEDELASNTCAACGRALT